MRRPLGGIHIPGATGFWGCSFCDGSGCLACQKQADREYKRQFPDGPKPVLSVPIYNVPGDLEAQASMVDDGCPNVQEPYVMHPDDALRVAELLSSHGAPR
jgi:hypothetical protein